MNLPELSDAVMSVSVVMDNDQVLEVRERVIAAKAAIRELEKELDESTLEWVKAHGNLKYGDGRELYAGKDKKVRCVDTAATLEAILVATGGDFDAVCECMSSQPFKQGTAHKPLGDAWSDHFEVEWADKVKVKLSDPRFGKKRLDGPTQPE